MCDSVLSFAHDNLLPLAHDHLLPVLKEAANLIWGVPKEIDELKDELEDIQKFINDVDRNAEAEKDSTHRGIRAKITQLIEASFLIEDVIDEYIIYEEQQTCCCAGDGNLFKTMILRLQIAYKIHNIKIRIREMEDTSRGSADHEYLQLEGAGTSTSSAEKPNNELENLREAPLYMDEADVVGFDAPRDSLIDLLLMERKDLTVVSVVAMGGQGKTTLAKKVFDSPKVVEHFDCCVWITVSESYTIEVLLRNMLQELYKKESRNPPPEILEMNRRSLRVAVRKILQQKRYVIVFDDVWNILFWADIEFSLIDNNNQSRILITSRNMEVVMSFKTSLFVEVHELQPLTSEKSFELFTKKAFHDLNGCCPKNLLYISYDIVDKCNGLPLAIVVIAGLLSRRHRNAIEWQKFSENLSFGLKRDSQLIMIKEILGFSYHDLPYNLKPCLLYFGLYPEDYMVNSKSLIRQWIAEGFVKEELGKTLEEVAQGYLMELIDRSLVQVSSISIDGIPKSCRVHDLLHVMILEKIEDLRFCKNFISGDDQSSLRGMIRRLSVTTDSIDLLESIESSHVRSLLFLTRKTLPKSFVKRMCTKYKLLKVLALESAVKLELPENFGRLVHLKCLCIRGMYMQYFKKSQFFSFLQSNILPKSIGMLQNLETLDLRGTYYRELPKEITRLRKLRHLLAYARSWIQLKDGIGGMASLQTLSEVCFLEECKSEIEIVNAMVELIEELGELKQLRELCLNGLPENHGSYVSSSINEMQDLEKLKVISTSEVIDFDLVSCQKKMLRSLTLCGWLDYFPKWIPELPNLVKLKLKSSLLTHDLVKSLKNMPNLLSLSITQFAYEGESLHFEGGGFENLKELYIEDSNALKSLVIEEGALQSLKKLQLRSLFQLRMVPIGIQHLKMLQVLKIQHMPTKFVRNIALNEARENPIIEHVPFVEIEIQGGKFIRRSRS